MTNHLSGGKVNLTLWRDDARKVLLDCLDRCAGSKAVVWDDQLTGPVGLIAEYSLLKEHEVDKMFPLRPGRLPIPQGPGASAIQNIIFIVRPQLDLMEIIADCVRKTEEQPGRFRKEYHIFFAPRKSLLCTKKLGDLAVYGLFTTIDEYDLELLPMDSDLLSMENEVSYKECYLLNDFTTLHTVSKALMKFQLLYGIIPKIYGKGICARNVTDILLRMRQEIGDAEFKEHPQVDYMLLIDRSADLLTPLATQLTYEGLIDEFFGISNCSAKFPPEKFAKKSDNQGQARDVSTEPKKIQLNSADELYSILRDKNFNAVGPELSRKAKVLSAQYEERKDAKTVRDIKQFVTKLPHIQLAKTQLATHTSIAELIKERTDKDSFMDSLQVQQEFMNGVETDKVNTYIEDCIAKKDSLIKVLRLLCMQSVANNGFKSKMYDYYIREILQTYGYEHILTLNNLEKAGLLKLQGPKTYGMIRKTLKLVVEDVNEQNPTDISYVHSGYAPLSVRLAQFLSRPGWRSIDEILRSLPGPTVEEEQKIPSGIERKKSFGESNQSEGMKVCLVFFLGGVTFSEIAALRFLSQQEDSQVEYIIGTTKIINGDNFLESLTENPVPDEEDSGRGSTQQQSRLR